MTVNIDWGLGSGAPDAGAMVQQGYELGQKQRDQTNLRRALGVLAVNPNDQSARVTVGALDPGTLAATDRMNFERETHLRDAAARTAEGDLVVGQYQARAAPAPALSAPAPPAPAPAPTSGALAALTGSIGPSAPLARPALPTGAEYGQVNVPGSGVAPAPASLPSLSPGTAALAGDGAAPVAVSAGPVASPATSAPPQDAAAARADAFQRLAKADPARAAAFLQQESARRIAQLDFLDKVAERGTRLLGKAIDQSSYEAAGVEYNAFLQANGLPAVKLPPTYSPETVAALQRSVLDTKAQIEEARQQATLAETIRNHRATEEASKFKTVVAKPGETVHVYNESTGEVDTVAKDGGDGGTPAPAAASGTAAPSSAPRSVRNNNPGNLRASGWTQKQPGYVGQDAAGYARFDSAESGLAAQATLLRGNGYMAGGRNSVQSIVEKWAPRASAGGDNTDAQVNNYIAYVSKQLGVKPGQTLSPDQAPQLAAAMARFESGATGKAGAVRTGDGSPAPAPAAGGGGSWPIKGPPVQTTTLDDEAIKQVAAAYKISKVMPPIARDKEMVKRILNASAAMSIQQAHAIADGQVHTWQDTKGAEETIKAFDKGPLGNQTRSLNVAIQHIDQLRTAAAALQNGNIPAFNAAAQALARATGRAAPTTFDALKQFVFDEVTKGVIGTAGGVHDRQTAGTHATNASSPQQLLGVLDGFQGLMAGQASGLQQQYLAATGREDYSDKYLLPRTRQLLLGQHGGGGVPTMTPDQVRAAPSGTVFRTTDGRTMRKR